MDQIYQGKHFDNPSCLYARSISFTYSQFGLPLFFNSTLMDVISPCGHIFFLPLNDSIIGPPSSHVLSLGCFLQHARKLMNHFMTFTYSKIQDLGMHINWSFMLSSLNIKEESHIHHIMRIHCSKFSSKISS
jgi:hypothetical protein